MKPITAVWVTAILAALLCAGCSTTKAPPSDPIPADPDMAVSEIRDAWFASPEETLHTGYPRAGRGCEARSRVMLRRQAENLVYRHPRHIDALMLCAVMAYEAEDPIVAERHLDQILRVRPSSPDAALLRARIAVEAGNPDLAERLLSEQVRLRPDHAGLRETLASVHFLRGNYGEAQRQLEHAERLGGDGARIAYNRGLLAEHRGDTGEAVAHYEAAIEQSPGWNMPADRLAGIAKGTSVAEGGTEEVAVRGAPQGYEVPFPPPLPRERRPAPDAVGMGAPPAGAAAEPFSEVPLRK